MKKRNNAKNTAADEELIRNLIGSEEPKKDDTALPEEEFVFVTDAPADPEKAPNAAEETAADTEPAVETEEAEAPAEAEPIAESAPETQPKKKEPGILGICLPLIIICIGVALMLAAVNALTKDTIAAQAAAEKERAVLAIFPDATSAQLYESTEESEVYLAIRDGELIGCCISLAEGGFAGDISMMIGKTTAGEICGVQIVSMSESPGIGTKTKNAAFLDQYRGGDTFVIGTNLDAIAGATVSSRAVTRGVNRALELPLDFEAIAAARGLTASSGTEGPGVPTDTETPDSDADTPTPDTSEPENGDPAETDEETAEDTDGQNILMIPTLSVMTRSKAVNRVLVTSTKTVDLDAPPETEAPADTEEPADTTAPADTDAPANTDEPADSEEPVDTDEPADSAEPADTDAPADTDVPADSDVPADTDTPPDTTAPADTEIPDDTDAPADTDETAVTDAPTETDAPADTDAA